MALFVAACSAMLPQFARLGAQRAAAAPSSIRSPHSDARTRWPDAVRMQLVWGKGPDVALAKGGPSLMELSVSYGWCLSDVELAEMESYQESLSNATSSYMTAGEIKQLYSALEIAYQSRSWSDSARSERRLQHVLAVARVLAELRMEVRLP